MPNTQEKRKRLTKTAVDAAKPGDKDYIVWCADLAGFGCRIRKSGSKTFIAQYRVGGGGRNAPVRKVTIGTYGKLTVEQARKEASSILAKAQLGEDVAEAKAKKRGEITVAQLCDEYLEDGCDKKKASTLLSDVGRIERHIKPLLGTKRISQVKRGDIERFMRDVAKGKTAIDEKTKKHGRSRVTGGKGTASRCVGLLGGIFSYAVNNGYLETNPRFGVKTYPDKKCERFLTTDEMKRLGDAIREAETIGIPWLRDDMKPSRHHPIKEENKRQVISPFAIAAIRLLLFTGCRVGEILRLRWNEVDFERGMLHLPDSKTGAKRILLAAPALEVLAELPRVGDYVIAGDKPNTHRHDIKRPWKRITAHAGLVDLRIHDIRHSFASVGAASGMGLSMVGKLLGHASPDTTARYSHFADDPLRRANEHIAGSIAAAIKPASADGDKVVPLRKEVDA